MDPSCPQPPDTSGVPTARQVMEKVLATDGSELSATATLRRRQNESSSLGRLLPIRDTLDAAAETGDADSSRAAAEIRHHLRLRAAQARQAQPARRPGATEPGPSYPTDRGVQR